MPTTLSVNEVSRDILGAIKTEVPELFLFAQDYSSNTAVLGDKITAGQLAELVHAAPAPEQKDAK